MFCGCGDNTESNLFIAFRTLNGLGNSLGKLHWKSNRRNRSEVDQFQSSSHQSDQIQLKNNVKNILMLITYRMLIKLYQYL